LNITIIGMGKIGLPLAVSFAKKGNKVTGLDINLNTIEKINSGNEPFPGEENLGLYLKEVIDNNFLKATFDIESAIKSADVILVCVPLIIDSNSKADFSGIDLVVENIGKYMRKGVLISIETTLPVGTTRNRFAKSIETVSSLRVGQEFSMVFSPERVSSGRIFNDLRSYPKLVGGVTESCTQKGIDFYEAVLDFDKRKDLPKPNGVWALQNCETAEFTKIAETTYRDVNIGLANEFALYADSKDIDFIEVIQAANSQPYSHLHSPGISVGGHCIPVYPNFYIQDNKQSQIVRAARERNLSMPLLAIQRIKEKHPALADLSVGVFGISYRTGVKESAFSGALELLKILKSEGANVYGFDPLFNEEEILSMGFMHTQNYSKLDGIILNTAHEEFLMIDYNKMSSIKFIFDGRNALTKILKNKHNFSYLSF